MLKTIKKLIRQPTREEFAEQMMDVFRQAGYDSIDYDREKFQLVSGSMVHNLHNLYAEAIQAWPWQRRALLKRHAEGFAAVASAETPTTWAQVEGRIFPAVRDRYYIEAVRRQAAGGGSSLDVPHQSFTERLCVTLVIDHPTLVQLVTKSHLESWGISFEEALITAKDNLKHSTQGSLSKISKGVYVSNWGDDYDAARMLLDETYRGLEVEGDPVVLVPNKNVLIVTGSEDPRGLLVAFELAEQQLDAPHPISVAPLVRKWPEFRPVELSPIHPAYSSWRRVCVLDYLPIYHEQSEDLQQEAGEDVFVASYTATQDRETGLVSSYCIWSKSVPSLLPETEEVLLFDPELGDRGELIGRVSWSDLVHHCGHLLEATEQYPPRYRVTAFPEEELITRMSQAKGPRPVSAAATMATGEAVTAS